MSTAIERFFDAWGLADDAARATAIAESFGAQGSYADPRSDGALVGPDAIASYVNSFSANAPGWTASVVKRDEIAGCIRCTVAFGGKGPDGADMVQHGQYFADMDGDRIARMVGFVGTGVVE